MSNDWQPPAELPDLRRVGRIALDTETKDGGLATERGSGWPFRDGHLCGISIAYRAEGSIRGLYFPLRHPDTQNFDLEQVYRWLKDHIDSDLRFVTQNGLYDWGWLRADAGIRMPPSDRLEELGALSTIVDENRYKYGLEALCAWRGVPGKDETLLREGCAALGLTPKGRKKFNPQAHIYQLPARFVGPYAEQDPISTLAVFESLNPVLDLEGTRAAYRLEIDLLPLVLEMRRRGIRIDIAAAERARDLLLAKRDAAFAELSEKLGANVGMAEIGRTGWLAQTFDRHGIKYPHTPKGNPSFTAGNSGWMHKHPHWLPQLIVKADKYNNAAVNFLETYILGHVVRGRVHAEIHPHRSDDGGTRSLRFSYSNPPLQLMPAHDEELAPLIRGVFLPEEGEIWAKPDISQQEFRFIVHYAARHKLRKASEAVALYRNDPNTDFHELVAQWASCGRAIAKTINFAKVYGAGVRTLAARLGKSEAEAREIMNRYDRELPFVSQLSAMCKRVARRQGYLELYDGARRHWSDWAPGGKWEKGAGPCAREEAERRVRDPDHPWYRQRLWRADTRKAMNALVQGSAARHTKLWMRACWREGIVPLLQMHDALDCSVSSREQAELVAQLGREAVTLEVPMQVDLKFGRNWGDAKHTWGELHAETSSHVELAGEVHNDQERAQRESPIFFNDFGGVPNSTPSEDTVEKRTSGGNGHAGDDFDTFGSGNGRSRKIRCPFHDDKTPSCQLYADGHYHCFGCGAHGWIDEDMDPDDDTLAKLVADAQDEDENDARKFRLAVELWGAGVPIADTLAARYLADVRRLDLTALPADVNAVLRFHPRCWFGPKRTPCLIALFRDVTLDTPAGIQRINLAPKIGELKRLTLGCWSNSRAIKLWPTTDELTIGEGIETVLGAICCGAVSPPAWAMGSRTNIASFPVLPDVKTLTILVDNDIETPTDAKAPTDAKSCAARWIAAGRTVRMLKTKQVKDFNDLVMP